MNSVSVVIPFYNRDKFLRRTLLSIWRQTYRPIELILVDNLSDDHSLEICKAFSSEYNQDDFVIKILNAARRGASIARNVGLSQATGRWISFFDSDDEMSADFLEKMVGVLRGTNLDLSVAATKMIFPDNTEKVRSVFYTGNVTDQILAGMISTQSCVLKTAFARHIGGWNEQLTTWDDWEFGVRILLARPRLKWMEGEVFHRIYQHGDSITGTSMSGNLPAKLHAIETVEKECGEDACREAARLALAARRILLAAQIAKEKEIAHAARLRQSTIGSQQGRFAKAALQVLYHYTAHGGKGGWYIFRIFLRALHLLFPVRYRL